MRVTDTLGRPLTSLRLSVTDRCNLRCQYCMPEAEYVWLPRESILTFEEVSQLVEAFTGLGVEKLRNHGWRTASAAGPAGTHRAAVSERGRA